MTAQEFLKLIDFLQKRIETNTRRVEQMQELLTKITPSISDMPKSSTPNVHSFEDRICAKVALEKENEQDRIQLERIKLDVVDAIMQIENEEYRDVLYKRYIEFSPWNVIIAELGYNEKYIFRLHKNALRIFIFNNGVREWLIDDLKCVVSWLPDEEEDLRKLTDGIIDKLSNMTDKEFSQISNDLIPLLDKD